MSLKVFLSASVPDIGRDAKYFETADKIAIRDAVKALVTVVTPRGVLVTGGHPVITPLIQAVLQGTGVGTGIGDKFKKQVIVYQSEYYKDKFQQDDYFAETRVVTPISNDTQDVKQKSLAIMRNKMLSQDFSAGVFIGGMEGVEEEFFSFRERHANTLVLPVASTGGAAKIIYDRMEPKPSERLLRDYAYMALFRDLLSDFINA
jgi:hypothetical protein